MTVITSPDVLTQDILDRCARRAPDYDRDNRFFHEDFEELRAVRLPARWPSRSSSAASASRSPRSAARQRASPTTRPATALATNMHVYWTGIAADLYRSGDRSLTWLLEEAVAGEVFAAGHGEAGNDLPGAAVDRARPSRSRAATASPATRCSVRSARCGPASASTRMDTTRSRPTRRSCTRSCRATPRATSINETWDTLGMRATRSDDTILDGAFVPDQYIARVVPGRLRGRRPVRARHLRLGRADVREHLPRRSPERAIDLAVAGAREAHVDRARRPDAGVPPDDPARGRRDGRSRSKARRRTSRRRPTTGRTVSTTAACGRRSSSRRSTTRSRPPSASSTSRWTCRAARGMFKIQRARAALPRRALRRLPPGEHRARARDRRQDRARRPRRTRTLVSVSA